MTAAALTLPRAETRRANSVLLLVVLLALLLAAIILSFGIGPLHVAPGDVFRIVLGRFGLSETDGISARDMAVIWNLRIPRALMGALIGAALALAGAGLQGLFGNPLADPGIVGVTHGSALGAIGAIVLGATALGEWTVPVSAFLGGLLATTLIYVLARPGRGSGTVTLLLVGIAIGAGCSAAIGFFTYRASEVQLQSLVFWQMGSLGTADWADLAAALPVFLIGLAGMLWLATPLDMLALGERQAQHIGLDVKRTRALLILCSSLLVGAAVAFAGIVGFVGLIVPHVVRLLAGPRHRSLLPLAAVAGALLVVVADTGARTLDPPSEIPLGLFTASLGAPFFLWLVMRQRPGGAR